MSEQIAVRIPDDLAGELDRLIQRGRFQSKAEAIRAGLRGLLDAERRRDIGERIVEGYTRIPQTDEEMAAAMEAALRSIEEEPW